VGRGKPANVNRDQDREVTTSDPSGPLGDTKKPTFQRRLVALAIVREVLGELRFGKVERPTVAENQPPTLELLDWAIKFYCYSLVSHFRELLGSFVALSELGHIPAAFIIGRALYEVGAHSYYVRKHVIQHRDAKDVEAGWKFMASINMGSRYMNRNSEVKDSSEPFPDPRDIGKIITCFSEWPNRRHDAHKDYSHLSEFAHPNMGAFSHYYDWSNGVIEFRDSPHRVESLPIGEVSIAVLATLGNARDLLTKVGLKDIARVLADSYRIYSRRSPRQPQ
jgi:hypothetical protein